MLIIPRAAPLSHHGAAGIGRGNEPRAEGRDPIYVGSRIGSYKPVCVTERSARNDPFGGLGRSPGRDAPQAGDTMNTDSLTPGTKRACKHHAQVP